MAPVHLLHYTGIMQNQMINQHLIVTEAMTAGYNRSTRIIYSQETFMDFLAFFMMQTRTKTTISITRIRRSPTPMIIATTGSGPFSGGLGFSVYPEIKHSLHILTEWDWDLIYRVVRCHVNRIRSLFHLNKFTEYKKHDSFAKQLYFGT